jgi:glyoxylase-like metal-dependent hydrolase (beta-lactamase superfamily II)
VSSEPTVADVLAWSDAQAEPVAPGVHRLPLPLPDELAAVNVYAVERPDGLTLIDAGQALSRCRTRLEDALGNIGYALADVREFLVTHAHRDHYTLGVQLRAELGAQVSLGIREAPSILATGDPDWPAFRSQLAELRRAGANALADEIAREAAAQALRPDLWQPPDRWVLDDAVLEAGSRRLRAIHTPGHTQGHLVFHDADAGLLFAGDHVLPHITPSIGLEPMTGRSPLADFLGSLRKVRSLPDAMLLPAHGPVAPSTHARIDELLAHHDHRLGATKAAVVRGEDTAFAVARVLTWTRREIPFDQLPGFHRMLAVVETAAHLRLLVDQCALAERQVDGVDRFRIPESDA